MPKKPKSKLNADSVLRALKGHSARFNDLSAAQLTALENMVRNHEMKNSVKFANLNTKIRGIEIGLGGMRWTTAAGDTRWIAFLSTAHLHNILAWPAFQDESGRSMVQAEIKRRERDEEFRKKELAEKAKAKRQTARLLKVRKDRLKRKRK
jgi:hypothetical protein